MEGWQNDENPNKILITRFYGEGETYKSLPLSLLFDQREEYGKT